jgi:hypothetical protein
MAPADRGRLEIITFIDAEIARREAAEKQPPSDGLKPYRLSLKQLARLRARRDAA